MFLNFVLAAEAVLHSTFVLMGQDRQDRQAEDRARLAPQVSLLAEQETTKIPRMQQAVCEEMGLLKRSPDPALKGMIETKHGPAPAARTDLAMRQQAKVSRLMAAPLRGRGHVPRRAPVYSPGRGRVQ